MTTYAITKIWRPHPESDYHDFKVLGLSTQENQCVEFIAKLRVEDAKQNVIIESVNRWRDNYYKEHPRPELMDRAGVRTWMEKYRQAYQEKFAEHIAAGIIPNDTVLDLPLVDNHYDYIEVPFI